MTATPRTAAGRALLDEIDALGRFANYEDNLGRALEGKPTVRVTIERAILAIEAEAATGSEGLPPPRNLTDADIERWYAAFATVTGTEAKTLDGKRHIYDLFADAWWLAAPRLPDNADEYLAMRTWGERLPSLRDLQRQLMECEDALRATETALAETRGELWCSGIVCIQSAGSGCKRHSAIGELFCGEHGGPAEFPDDPNWEPQP